MQFDFKIYIFMNWYRLIPWQFEKSNTDLLTVYVMHNT